MAEFWFADENIVFSIAIVVMLALGVLQLFGLGEFGPDFDTGFDADSDVGSSADGLLALLGLGRLPLIMFLVLLLAIFAIVGFAGQQIYASLFGELLTAWIAAPGAGVLALFLTGLLARPLSRVLPHDETTAVDRHSLVGRRAVIQTGTARKGYAARAKTVDGFGQTHFVMVEPENAGIVFSEGDEVLMVRAEGDLFTALPTDTHQLLRLEE